jgi:hypothetical protein
MRPLLVVLLLMAAVATGGILAGPLLKADRREEISLPAVLAWPTFAHGMKESKQ